jgi:EAL domain-containing protein (putative c-di-GMP-specific phosphodiesterase class I)
VLKKSTMSCCRRASRGTTQPGNLKREVSEKECVELLEESRKIIGKQKSHKFRVAIGNHRVKNLNEVKAWQQTESP